MRGRYLLILTLMTVVALAAGCGSNSFYANNAANLQQSVNSDWTTYKAQRGVTGGGMAAYVAAPNGNYFAASGMPAGTGPDTRFRIASITKTFTAAAIMLLNQQGKLNIDDTIVSLIPGQSASYVPSTPQYDIPYKSQITIRQVLSHTSGIFDVDNDAIPMSCAEPYAGQYYRLYIEESDPNHQFTPDEFVGVDAACQISYFVPGTGYHYSDTGYSLLAIIIERASGMSYDQFLTQNLLLPNGLSSTSVIMLGSDQVPAAPYTPGYLYSAGALTDVTQDNMSAHIGEGNITSTPADLARWVRLLMRGEAGLNADTVAAMKTLSFPGISPYGLGIVYTTGLGYGHNGANQGYLSLMKYDPQTDVTVILYFNVWDLANLFTYQNTLLTQAAQNARGSVGY
jgi:D-alanyl-D-alanine carboxypeptidase